MPNLPGSQELRFNEIDSAKSMRQDIPITPIAGSNRIALLDIYRGFALLGIFLVNIRYMSASVNYYQHFEWMIQGKWNAFTAWILEQFFDGKFYPIFSFLFGVGFGMQLNKMEEKGLFSTSFFIRRYFILLLFGLFHLIFIWGGDVLMLYALAGFIVLIIRKLPVKYVLLLALFLLMFPFYGHLINYITGILNPDGHGSFNNLKDYTYTDVVAINRGNSLVEHMKFRLLEYTVYYRNIEYFPSLLFIILCGYSAGRYKFYKKIPETLKKLGPVFIGAFILVILLKILYYRFKEYFPDTFVGQITCTKFGLISNITQAFLYLYAIAWLYEKRIFIKILEPLAFAGRMSLSNYIAQSILGYILFNGMVFSLYGKLGFAWLAVIAVLGYLILLITSKLWLTKFRYGPLEYIWRDLSYKRFLVFVKKENNSK
jgi:uncharacterized protein